MPPPRRPAPSPPPLLVPLLLLLLFGGGLAGDCGGRGEWRCGGEGRCISLNKFCDGIVHCEDGSDEPLGCTNCNQTFYGEANVKYPLRVTGPFQRYLPFVCRIAFDAEAGGDFVELTFLSFQIGRLETRNQSAVCQKGFLKISEWPEGEISSPHVGEFCGSMGERSVTFYSQKSNVRLLAVVPSRASIPSSSFGLYLTYRFLNRGPALEAAFLGHPVEGTFCDREFLDCHSNRRCRIRTPNFPGFYPRNITCHYSIRHPKAPEGYASRVVLSQPNDYKISVPTGGATSSPGTSFSLSTDCLGGDSVRVFDGASPLAARILEFCGSGALPDVVSSGNELLVQIRSAPYQQLSNSRVEIEVSVRYEMLQSGQQGEEEGAGPCFLTLDASRRRWGVVTSPRHTMPPNADCTYRLVGASKHDRIWLTFVSFFALVEKRPTSPDACSVSRLEIHGLGGNGSAERVFCGEAGPRLCAHAADYPPHYLPPRPCEVPAESYLSAGPELLLRHRSLAPELLTAASSFTARYEFVDTRQHGLRIDHSECDRRLDSRLDKRGTIANARNVFLYGRGGRRNLTCVFHFVGLPTERLVMTVRRTRLKSAGSLCRSHRDPVLQRHECRMSKGEGRGWSSLGASEHWAGYSSPVGCVCDVEIDEYGKQVAFESVASNVKLTFEVVGMSHLEDFDDYFFEVEYEFLNDSVCDAGVRRHAGPSGGGALAFRLPPSHRESPPTNRPVRCRWKIEASPHKHLYLTFKGFNASALEECRIGTRLLVYLEPRGRAVADACVVDGDAPATPPVEELDLFSHAWFDESEGAGGGDRLFVEMAAPYHAASFSLHWLEVTRPFVRTQSGQTLRNVDCLFECPEIGACIDPELWCDGTHHCPSGYDESPDHCALFPLTYVSCAAAGLALGAAALLAGFAARRWRKKRRLGRKRRFSPDPYCVESPVG